VPENLVQVREHKVYGDGFPLEIGQPDELLIEDGFGFFEGAFYIVRLEGFEVGLERGPCLIEHLREVGDVPVLFLPGKVPEFIPRLFGHPLCNLTEPRVERFGKVIMETLLPEPCPETVSFKQPLVIWRVIGYLERGMCKSLYKQTPVFICLTKVYGAVHCLHPSFAEPFPGGIEEHAGRRVIINALKESCAAGRLVIGFCNVEVDKGCYASDEAVVIAGEHPSGGGAVFEIGIYSGIEDAVYVPVERTDPRIIIPVNDPCGVKEHPFRFPVSDLDELHVCDFCCRSGYLL